VIAGSINEYRTKSLGHSLKKLIEGFELNLSNLFSSVDNFDASVQLIVHHEVAHAYVDQFAHMRNDMSEQDFRAFEFITDMVAT